VRGGDGGGSRAMALTRSGAREAAEEMGHTTKGPVPRTLQELVRAKGPRGASPDLMPELAPWWVTAGKMKMEKQAASGGRRGETA